MKNVRLLPRLARSSDLSPIENVWSMVPERLARHHTPITTVDELWYLVEVACGSVSPFTLAGPELKPRAEHGQHSLVVVVSNPLGAGKPTPSTFDLST
ncbi:hypothetical protein TNCV_2830631 [Trichonephila clavipes]|nr:hypothetical protein TNCV_2830631 [Trichonephila clavipes]